MGMRLLMRFNQQGAVRANGWSELIFTPTEDLKVAEDRFFSGEDCYTNRRLNLLGAGVLNVYNTITWIPDGVPSIGPQRRVVKPKAGTPAFLVPGGGFPYYNPDLKDLLADFSQEVQMYRLSTDPTGGVVYTRSLWLAGSPDFNQDISYPEFAPGSVTRALDAFKAMMTSGLYGMQVVDHGGTNPLKICSHYDGGTGTYTVTGHGFTEGQRIIAAGFRAPAGSTAAKGQYRVFVVDANNIQLHGSRNASSYDVLGGFRLFKLVTVPIKGMDRRGVTNKKHGRIFGQPVGRRSKPKTPRS